MAGRAAKMVHLFAMPPSDRRCPAAFPRIVYAVRSRPVGLIVGGALLYATTPLARTMVVVAMTPRMMVSAFASPAKPKSPSDQSVKVGPMALAGAHRSITMTMRVVASKGRNENARALATADTTPA